ncbi:calcium-transporting ATPase 8, plasma membrane-type-like protein [Tanacetum coccineum]
MLGREIGYLICLLIQVIGSAIEVLPQYDIGSLRAPQSSTPTGHYDVSPEQLADMTCEHDFVKGLTEKLKTNPKKGISEDESNILNMKNLFGSNTYPQKKGRSLGYFLIRFLLGAYWDTTLVILMVATAASLALFSERQFYSRKTSKELDCKEIR